MSNRFLCAADYGMQIRAAILAQVKNSDEALEQAENSAITEMESYLRIKYDVAKILAPLIPYSKTVVFKKDQRIILTAPAHDATKAYADKEIILKDGFIWRAKAVVVIEPWTEVHWDKIARDKDLWYVSADTTTMGVVLDAEMKAGDTRYPVLLMYLKDMVIYHIFSNISVVDTPKTRTSRYDAAIKWLDMITRDKLSPDLPLATNQNTAQFKFGSHEKVTERW